MQKECALAAVVYFPRFLSSSSRFLVSLLIAAASSPVLAVLEDRLSQTSFPHLFSYAFLLKRCYPSRWRVLRVGCFVLQVLLRSHNADDPEPLWPLHRRVH